jgi:hypothetical protein
MIILIILAASVALNLVLGYGAFNLLRKNEAFEDNMVAYDKYFESLQRGLATVIQQIQSVDIRGAFEADDEVGVVFAGIKGMVYTLNKFLERENDGSKEAN